MSSIKPQIGAFLCYNYICKHPQLTSSEVFCW
nr:MAG TPA: hypothetical protein [Caudoviricetes sp.]